MTLNPRQDALVSGDFSETRSEEDLNAPIEWRGLPEFRAVTRDVRLVLSFDAEEERDRLVEQLGITISKKTGSTWSAWWPPRDRDDLSALRFDFDADEQGEDRPEQPEPDELGGVPPSQPSPDEEPPGDRDDPEPADAPETAATTPTPSESRPWPEHIGHQVSLTYVPDGSLVGAWCSTCGVALPRPPERIA